MTQARERSASLPVNAKNAIVRRGDAMGARTQGRSWLSSALFINALTQAFGMA